MAEASITPTKRCTKCGEYKPATTECFSRHKECRGGLNSQCKACVLDYGNRWRRGEASGPPKGMTADGLRICNHCGVAKEPNKENFAPTPRGRFGLHATCRPCLRSMERRRLGIADDPYLNGWIHEGKKRCFKCREIKPATEDHFASSKKFRSGLRSYCKACQANDHLAYVSKIGRAEKNRRGRSAPSNTPENRRRHYQLMKRKDGYKAMKLASEHKRRARKLAAPGCFTKKDVPAMHSAQAGRCWWCSCKLEKFHIDHRIPLSRGGSNGPENLVLACPTCNLRKSAKMPWELEVPRLL